ncbi:MAG: cobalt-precorrin-5B (C(1))-methyltransferase CbiD [Lachnospiraceae bacterium]|nr:cobalt-precorrin-5B (C(1))-methyltransferase CbiD [Lachnospiraceae bacterium]
MGMDIFFIRHGSTAGNLEHRYVGATDEPLTGETFGLLKKKKEYYPQPDCVFSSPLRRCVQTAEALFPETEIRFRSGLRELDFGEFEYKNYEDLKDDKRYQAWIDSGGTAAFPGGEDRNSFCDRCCAAFEEACREALDAGMQKVAFVVHGGTIMAILDRFSRPHRDYFEWQVKNAEGFSCKVRWADSLLEHTGEAQLSENTSEYSGEFQLPENTSEYSGKFQLLGNTSKYSGEFQLPGNASGDVGTLLCLENIRALPQSPGLTGIEDEYVMNQNKKMRCGYTTGTCAAAAAKAAAQMLLTGRICYWADLLTPKGIRLHLPVEEQELPAPPVGERLPHTPFASCAVRKYAGDDPDATDGILVFARAEYILNKAEKGNHEVEPVDGIVRKDYEGSVDAVGDHHAVIDRNAEESSADSDIDKDVRVAIDGGIGVGRVTKPGLEQPVGAAAINRVPREMIAREVESVCEEFEYPGRLKITISVPEGVEIAKRTFNPHLGIRGGISILGTSGIVAPMSEEALIASIRVEMKQKVALGEQYILITPGNYGADFIRRGTGSFGKGRAGELAADDWESRENELPDTDNFGRLSAEDSMKCSNYVGETLDIAAELGVKGILFVAHIGKFIKVSGGVMNTHSAHADCRAELIAAQAMRAGTPPEIVRRLLDTNTMEEAVEILAKAGWLRQTMEEVTSRIQFHLQKHCRGALETEAVIFSSQYGYLGETDGADAMAEKISAQPILVLS